MTVSGPRCFCCHKEDGTVTEMTDGTFSTLVCEKCREMVTTFFHVYGELMHAVLEVAQAKRGSTT